MPDSNAEVLPDRVTDDQALDLLPTHRLARKNYHELRSQGYTPEQALQETRELWRTMYEDARPQFHSHRS